jgi:hypothetical protein
LKGFLKNFKTLKAGAGLVMEARQEAVQQHQADGKGRVPSETVKCGDKLASAEKPMSNKILHQTKLISLADITQPGRARRWP